MSKNYRYDLPSESTKHNCLGMQADDIVIPPDSPFWKKLNAGPDGPHRDAFIGERAAEEYLGFSPISQVVDIQQVPQQA